MNYDPTILIQNQYLKHINTVQLKRERINIAGRNIESLWQKNSKMILVRFARFSRENRYKRCGQIGPSQLMKNINYSANFF